MTIFFILNFPGKKKIVVIIINIHKNGSSWKVSTKNKVKSDISTHLLPEPTGAVAPAPCKQTGGAPRELRTALFTAYRLKSKMEIALNLYFAFHLAYKAK